MRFGILVVLLFNLAISAAMAQQYQPKTITFAGYKDASSEELEQVAGIHLGTPITQEDIRAAAEKLNATGLFSNIKFQADNTGLHFDLAPAEILLPVSFENFPWWTDEEIVSQVHAHVPLFHGTLPPTSTIQQQVTDALIALLATKGVTATVEATQQEEIETGKLAAIRFRILTPPITVGAVTFTGVGSGNSADIEPIALAATGQDYSSLATAATLSQAIKNVYHNKGYLEETTASFSPKEPAVQSEKVVIPISMEISEGPQFRLGTITLAGDVLMSKDDFQKRSLLHTGDIAQEDKLRNTLYMVATPYRAKGYLRANIAADATRHQGPPATVDYAINVRPGDVFHMGKLTLEGFNDTQKAEFLESWTMNPGDVFDATYPPGFLKKNAAKIHSLDDFSATYKQSEHEDTHAVDLLVTVRKGGPLSK
jgi:outer membrane protein insertion porin family